MNKAQWIAATAQAAGVSKKDTERVLDAALDLIVTSLAKGEKVQLSGFGVFEVKHRQARVGRNPITRETMQIPASRVPTFKPSQGMKDMVEE